MPEPRDGRGLHLQTEHLAHILCKSVEDVRILHHLTPGRDGPDVRPEPLGLWQPIGVAREQILDVLTPGNRERHGALLEPFLLSKLIEHRRIVGALRRPAPELTRLFPRRQLREEPVPLRLITPGSAREPLGLSVVHEALGRLLPARRTDAVHLRIPWSCSIRPAFTVFLTVRFPYRRSTSGQR